MSSILPISVEPSSYWDGNDGSWNTFIVQAGTPPQEFRTLPSTWGQETWLLNPQGCTSTDVSDCAYLRGALPFDGKNSSGFESGDSNTWSSLAIYNLLTPEPPPGITGSGYYGFDTITWGNGSDSVSQTHQIMASIADKSLFLGVFGLGPRPSNFSDFNNPQPCFLANLVTSKKIASRSWGYTAGAAYRNQAPASLTLGGYDANRFEPATLTFPMNPDDSRPLQVRVSQITGVNTLTGVVSLLPDTTYHLLDSTVPQVWLPDSAIDLWVSAFGLTYDNNTDLFLVNDTTRSQLLDSKASITFALANSTIESHINVQNIELPYSAFDLEVSWPYYENATRYFPIRRAANESQYSIGRAFFQEAYVIADYDSANFTVAQARFDSLDSKSLVTIAQEDQTVGNSTALAPSGGSSGLSTGATAGIAVGVVLGVFAAVLIAWLCIRKRRKQRQARTASKSETATGNESPFDAQHEKTQPWIGELESDTAKWGATGVQEVSGIPLGHQKGYLEAPGDSSVRHELPESHPELPGDEPVRLDRK